MPRIRSRHVTQLHQLLAPCNDELFPNVSKRTVKFLLVFTTPMIDYTAVQSHPLLSFLFSLFSFHFLPYTFLSSFLFSLFFFLFPFLFSSLFQTYSSLSSSSTITHSGFSVPHCCITPSSIPGSGCTLEGLLDLDLSFRLQ
jgi:hypothetical protein